VEIRGATVVITGASSGIGRATARAFSKRGASVVLAARREEPLRELADELGGLAVPTDVSDPDAVEMLAAAAVDRYGRVDVWVNNAGVYLVGSFESTPPDVFRRVLETNYLGSVNGARAALRRFREQGRGTLVFVGSVDAHVGAAHVASYAASKAALVRFAESLRQELRKTDGIDVCVVSPAAIDTPLFQHAGNYSGRALKALTPTFPPDKVADAIVRVVERPRRETVVGSSGKLLLLQRRLAPTLVDRTFAKQMETDQFGDGSAPATDGNVFEPVGEGTGEKRGWQTVSPGTRRAAGLGALAGAALAAGVALRRAR
jgi:short-subunit dehydrogenase